MPSFILFYVIWSVRNSKNNWHCSMKYIPLSLNLEDTWSIIHLWTYTTLFSITAAMSVLHWSSCCSHFSLGLGASTMMSFLSPFLKTLASITFSLGSLTMQMVNMIGIWQILNMFWSRYVYYVWYIWWNCSRKQWIDVTIFSLNPFFIFVV